VSVRDVGEAVLVFGWNFGAEHVLDVAVGEIVKPEDAAVEFLEPFIFGGGEDDDGGLAVLGYDNRLGGRGVLVAAEVLLDLGG